MSFFAYSDFDQKINKLYMLYIKESIYIYVVLGNNKKKHFWQK